MQSTGRSQKKQILPFDQRAAFTPAEFAQLFGKQTVWAYRLIYADKIKSIKGFGRTLIPRSELDQIISSAQ
jgi:hypothetical protein